MKKLLLVLPTLLLFAAPVSALAKNNSNDNHGSAVSQVAKEREENHGSVVSSVAKDNHGQEEKLENEEHSTVATSEAKENSQLKIKIKIDLRNKVNHGSTLSATHSATPSARISVSGPLDQVIAVLTKVLDFLKSLI